MNKIMRRQLVAYLLHRKGLAESIERLALATDAELRRLASVRLADVCLDMSELQMFGLWPMPAWMVEEGVKFHGWDHLKEYF